MIDCSLSEPGAWRPIADGALAARLRVVLADVADALRHSRVVLEDDDPGLANGSASLAIFYAYLARAFPGAGWEAEAEAYLDHAIERVGATKRTLSLFGGLCGVAWALEHLSRAEGAASDPQDDDGTVDEALVELLETRPWRGHYDLISGLVGYGVYGLERTAPAARARIVALVVARLDEAATRIPAEDGEQVTFWTDPAWLPSHYAARTPAGEYNLGVAHGVPGVIAMLGAACRAGIAVAIARPLLEGAVRWLGAQRLGGGSESRHANHIVCADATGAAPRPARAAWCYGDPGIAVALLGAARALGRPDLEREAIDLGLFAARRPPSGSGVLDAGVCHGAAGLAHIFNRLHGFTGAEAFAEAARRWLERTLLLRRPGAPIAGFPAYRPVPAPRWEAAPGILDGAAGVGLVLLSAVAPVAPDWDRFLLCS